MKKYSRMMKWLDIFSWQKTKNSTLSKTANNETPVLKEPIVFFDIDDTLVSWDSYNYDTTADQKTLVEFICPNSGKSFWLEAINENINAMKVHKLRGHTVVLWSAGGAEWAKEVSSKLEVAVYVDAYMSKPSWFYDDIPSSSFMPESNRRHARLKG